MLSKNLEENRAIKVLYIEDDASYANLIRIFLEQASYNIYSFVTKESLKEGLEVLEEDEDISVTLLDLNLPDSRGLDTLDVVHKKFPSQNIIVLTGQDDENLGLKAVQSGAQDYLVKNEFDDRGLVKSIQYAIERSAAANRLAEAQRIAKIGNWISIPETNYFFLSPVSYKLFGLDSTQYEFNFEEIHQPDHPFYPLLELEDEVVNRRKLKKEIAVKWPNGNTRYLSVLCELSLSPNGNYIFNGVLQDITVRKRAEEMRKARDTAKQDTKFREKVFADLSEEISNPVRGILGITHLFEKESLSEKQLAYIRSIQQSAKFLDKTIAKFIAEGMLNEPKVKKKQFFLQDLLESLKSTIAPDLKERGISLSLEINERINWSIFLPQNLFRQVLFMVLRQACDQAQKKVSIKVDLIEEQGKIAKIQWLISDDGATHQGHLVFEDSTKPELTMAKIILENMGGHIGYYDNPSKFGNVFFLELVVEKGRNVSKEVLSKKKKTPKTNDAIKLLILERNPMNQILIRSTIKQQLEGAQLYLAANAQEALEIAKAEAINLVLLDMEGAKKDIFDITSYFTEQADSIPILALSSVDYTNHQNDLRNYGLDDFILKPYDPEQLVEKLSFYANIVA